MRNTTMKILLTSDLHVGLTKEKNIRKMLQESKEKNPDVIVHAGDACGGQTGYKGVRLVIKLIREQYPNTPILSVLGNHDLWSPGKKVKLDYKNPSIRLYQENYNKIMDIFEKNSVHFLDIPGVYVHEDFPHIKIVGHSGWYNHSNPPTNDKSYLPVDIEGNTNNFLFKKAMAELDDSLTQLDKIYDDKLDTVVFVSHFPVIVGKDRKGNFDKFGGNTRIGDILQKKYNCKHFLEGHSHFFENGPLKYNCGSDYYNPKYLEIKI